VPPSDVGNVVAGDHVVADAARFMPKMETHEPDWIVVAVLNKGPMPEGETIGGPARL
jgi:hypothetical protein